MKNILVILMAVGEPGEELKSIEMSIPQVSHREVRRRVRW
jgi:hypothetical protein